MFSDVNVDGYHRSNGAYVEPHYRSSPNDTKSDNWSTYGNENPYTGEEGTRRYDDYNNYGAGSNYSTSEDYSDVSENKYSKYGVYSSSDCGKMEMGGAIDDCYNYFSGGENPAPAPMRSLPEEPEKPIWIHLLSIVGIYIMLYFVFELLIIRTYEYFTSSIYEVKQGTIVFLLILTIGSYLAILNQ